MKVLWVLENIRTNLNSYGNYIDNKLDVLLLLASVYLWKKNHPEDHCVLYADNLTINYLDKIKLLYFWDDIQPVLPSSKRINKDVFWASSKVEVLSKVNEPVIIMDHDTHVYKPIKHLLNPDTTYVCNYEIGEHYYPTNYDSYIKKLTPRERFKTDSCNVSFLYLPDPEFTKIYANKSLDMMEQFTKMNVPDPQYLIFAEQLLLRHLLDKNNIKHNSIISTYWDCNKRQWGKNHKKGLFDYPHSNKTFLHYGTLKGEIRHNMNGFNYENVCKSLLNMMNLSTLQL